MKETGLRNFECLAQRSQVSITDTMLPASNDYGLSLVLEWDAMSDVGANGVQVMN